MERTAYDTLWDEYVEATHALMVLDAKKDYSVSGLEAWMKAHCRYTTLYELIQKVKAEQEPVTVIDLPAPTWEPEAQPV